MPASAARKRPSTVTRRYGGRDAVERRRERQRKLIDAGLELFGQKGFHQTTVRDLCKQAGLTDRYFYESFKTPTELYDVVYAELHTQMQQRVMAAIMSAGARSSGQPLAMGEASLLAWLTFLQEDPRRAHIMLMGLAGVSENGVRRADGAIHEMKGLLRSFIGMLYPELDRIQVETELVISGLVGAYLQITKTWVEDNFSLPVQEVVRHIMLFYRSLDAIYRHTLALSTTSRRAGKGRLTPVLPRPEGTSDPTDVTVRAARPNRGPISD